jgi:hypothetical protein
MSISLCKSPVTCLKTDRNRVPVYAGPKDRVLLDNKVIHTQRLIRVGSIDLRFDVEEHLVGRVGA